MITAGRLKELIKQNGLIFDKYGSEIDLRSGDGIYFAFSQNRLFKMKEIPNIALEHWRLNEIFETKEQAEWHAKTYAERTERFEPPMWEDIPNSYGFYRFVFSHNNHYASFSVNKEHNHIGIAIDLVSTYDEPATKENYIKACEIVRDLFNKGGVK